MPEHRCRACVVECIDFRLHDPLEAFYFAQGFDKDFADVVRVAGAAKDIVAEGTPAQAFILGQLETSRRLHHITEIVLVNHEDCGAYGPEIEPDSEEELARHRADLRAAKALLSERFPGLAVSTYFMKLDGTAVPIE